jgi:probable F420-dependent oxidoreductase
MSTTTSTNALGPLGVWATTDAMPVDAAVAFAGRVEELGYSTLWLPEAMGRDPFAHIAHLAGAAPRLRFASGIANIHHRHPGAMLQAANTVAEQTGGRFLLGLGVSHQPLVEGLRGLDYGRPVATMRRYLEAMASSPYMASAPADTVPRLVGALGPKMVALAGELADGVHPYWTTPEHTAGAREILGAGKLVCVEQKVVLTDDPGAARDTARQALSLYADLPNYRNNWLRLGFSDADIDARADSFVDALVAWGDAASIVAHVRRHLDAGADHVCIQPLTVGSAFFPDETALATIATEAAATGLLTP